MTEKRKIILIILFAFIIIGIGLSIMIQTPIGQKYFFKGNRITVDLKVFVDDKELSLDQLVATCTFEKKDCDITSDNGTFHTAGGNYGLYKFTVTIPKERLDEYGKDILLKLNYLNANNWYISNSDCVIYLKTDNNTLTGKTEVTVKYNDNTSQNYIKDVKSLDNSIDINWGL
ncbi:hypothetical protein [[Clostridium] fimetarium]|uniref:Uncharacterized protein n=1 Tax=[Clostridium] fimetarium TaxID=99656 RepID=A0A1I0QIP8_9FIRM|nr:hypothetical protein [[Clostridium] fimetarium]SEW26783.1 hypothetical protein SAMN05421659_10846 [[Clostridium] fimetarium]